MVSLGLGLLADSSIQLNKLETIVLDAGYTIVQSLVVKKDALDNAEKADAWIMRVDAQNDTAIELLEKLDDMGVPVIFDDVDTYSGLDAREQAKRLSKKVEACVNVPKHENGINRAKKVWVLAASTGGPEAVMTFVKLIPEDLDDVAFIYVQHIDERMNENLSQVLGRNTSWSVNGCDKSQRINERSFYLLSPEHQIEFDESGYLVPLDRQWEGPYRPSVDQVIAKVARKYGKQCGAIIFSGMGDDGSKTCRLIVHAGGQVWVQEPSSCAVDSMPKEAIATDCVSYIGSPELLAKHFTLHNRVEKNN